MKRYVIMNSQFGSEIESYDTVTEALVQIKDYNVNLGCNYGLKDNQDGNYTNFEELKQMFPNFFNLKEYDLTDDGTGKKYDTGKSMIGTAFQIFANSLLGIGACVEFGTHKYPKSDNWKLVDDGINRYTNSLMRHLAKHFSGQEKDPETGLPHLFHAGWNMLAIIEFYLMEHPDIVKEIQK